jgi:hypothetical protein
MICGQTPSILSINRTTDAEGDAAFAGARDRGRELFEAGSGQLAARRNKSLEAARVLHISGLKHK